jgi:Zn-dependent membrane protease YugP
MFPVVSFSSKWAAYTYVVAALGSLAILLYYIMIFTGARDE